MHGAGGCLPKVPRVGRPLFPPWELAPCPETSKGPTGGALPSPGFPRGRSATTFHLVTAAPGGVLLHPAAGGLPGASAPGSLARCGQSPLGLCSPHTPDMPLPDTDAPRRQGEGVETHPLCHRPRRPTQQERPSPSGSQVTLLPFCWGTGGSPPTTWAPRQGCDSS